MNWKPYVTVALVSLLSHTAGSAALAQGQVSQSKGVTTLTLPNTAEQADTIDYVNAQSLDLPSIPGPSDAEAQADLINALTAPAAMGEPGSSPGRRSRPSMPRADPCIRCATVRMLAGARGVPTA